MRCRLRAHVIHSVPNPEQDDDRPPAQRVQPFPEPSRPLKLTRYLNDIALRASNENPLDLVEDSELTKNASANLASSSSLNNLSLLGQPSSLSQNPESDSFHYIETLLEALSVLGKLGSALDTIAQRLPVEIYGLIDNTIEEVRERSEFTKRASTVPSGIPAGGRLSTMYILVPGLQPQTTVAGKLRLAALEAHAGRADREPLSDLFWTLYSKLDAVLQGLRIVYEVSNRIGSVRKSAAALLLLIDRHPSEGTSRIPLAPSLVHCSPLWKYGSRSKQR